MNHSVSNIKSESICTVMEVLAGCRHLSREEIANRSQLSLTTVSNILNGLQDYGLLSQKHPHTSKTGRNPAVFGFSDSIAMLILRVDGRTMSMHLMDFRMNPLLCLHRDILPARDPGECFWQFILTCREELSHIHRRIILCGLVNDSPVLSNEMLDREIQVHLKLSVILHDSASAAIARAALHQGIATEDRCTVILSHDGSCEGMVLHGSKPLRGADTELCRNDEDTPIYAEELIHTVHMLSKFLAPDTILICTMQDPEELRRQLAEAQLSALSLRHIAWEVRSTNLLIAHGTALAMRLQWIENTRNDMHRLRETPNTALTPMGV